MNLFILSEQYAYQDEKLTPEQDFRLRELILPLTPGPGPSLLFLAQFLSSISLSSLRHCLQFTYVSKLVAIYPRFVAHTIPALLFRRLT